VLKVSPPIVTRTGARACPKASFASNGSPNTTPGPLASSTVSKRRLMRCRSPGAAVELPPVDRRRRLRAQGRAALGTVQVRALLHHELATDEALHRRAAQQREQLLL